MTPFDSRWRARGSLFYPCLLLCLLASPAEAGSGVSFVDISQDPSSGIDYERGVSATFALYEDFRELSQQQPLGLQDLAIQPTRVYGIPGVAILDFDGDDDLDFYVTNGPGRANSLYSNQLAETGSLSFVDIGEASGVAATQQDSTGACYGDIDNDFDPDLLVLGRSEPNRLFENLGDGTFAEVSGSGLEGAGLGSISCSMGDIDGDGLLDVVIANTFDFTANLAIFVEPFALNHPNELFTNDGDGTFTDRSETSGVRDMAFIPPGASTITWATTLVDVDLDGDQDIVFADDQGALPTAVKGGLDRGFLHVLINDGTGHFSDQPVDVGIFSSGSWMGLAFGDLNCDGVMDLFGSNFGDYNIPTFGNPYTLGEQGSRWFYGSGNGTFVDPGLGSTVSSSFGWGNAIFDYDNDGDQDILYHGSLELNYVVFADNPGLLLENQGCGADYSFDFSAFPQSYLRRNVQGTAIGDLDRDGFVDVVTASNLVIPEALPVLPSPASYGSELDALAGFAPVYVPGPDGFVWSGAELSPGVLSVEINEGGDARPGVTLKPVGTVGLVPGAAVNRSGFGAVMSFTPRRGESTLMPILGGSSLASQNAGEAYFGLGEKRRGTLEVLWPGGVRNRLYNVRRGETLTIPEIPCSFDDGSQAPLEYFYCVADSLHHLKEAGVISRRLKGRLFVSALRAYFDR